MLRYAFLFLFSFAPHNNLVLMHENQIRKIPTTRLMVIGEIDLLTPRHFIKGDLSIAHQLKPFFLSAFLGYLNPLFIRRK